MVAERLFPESGSETLLVSQGRERSFTWMAAAHLKRFLLPRRAKPEK